METKSRNIQNRKRRKRKKNKKNNAMGTVVAIVAVGLVAAGGIYGYNQIPDVKVDKYIGKAKKYEEVQDYENALASYEEALKVESTTVKTYQYMANLYLDMDNYKGAEEILYRGMEETGDSQLQTSYQTVVLNESVLELNEGICNFFTVERCLEILGLDSQNTSAYELLNTCYERFCKMEDENGQNIVLSSTEEGLGFEAYKLAVDKMISLYERDQKKEMKELLLKYIGFKVGNLYLPMEYYEDYLALVKKADAIVSDENMEELKLCLDKSLEIRNLFAPILTDFEAGNYEVAREFIVSDEYVAIRDAFISDTMEYWEGKTYIPVSDIGIKLHFTENSWNFSFVDEDKKAAEHGYIKVWGSKWLDNGHQRTVISYVPVSKTAEYYPLTEYSMMYWWSTPINMELTENTYARMNFRFEENTYTQEGKTTKAINDWGGKYEYRDIYE